MIRRRTQRRRIIVAFVCSFVAGTHYFGSRDARATVNVLLSFLNDGSMTHHSESTIVNRLRAKCGVITTILEVNDAVRYIASSLNASLVVIGDHRTNHTEWHAFQQEHAGVVLYLSPAEQVGLPFRILRHIPWNHFGRKSIGFLYAVAGGCHQIYDFDDDNHLKKPEGFERVSSWDMYELGSTSQTVHVFNPYPYFQPTDDLLVVWPRGFPLQFINDNRTYDVKSDAFDVKRWDGADFEKIAVLQSLADHDPDVDAIYRMTRPLPISFRRQETILIPPRAVYTPWNAQAMVVFNSAFFGLLLPVTVTGCVSDIWRSYITTRLLWETRYRVAFTSPFVTQYRNPHSYIVDFADEDDLYNKVDDLLYALASWTSDGHDTLETAYVDLITKLVREEEILGETDLQLAKSWVEDLKAIGYVWPTIEQRMRAQKLAPTSVVDQRHIRSDASLESSSHSQKSSKPRANSKLFRRAKNTNAVCLFGLSEVNTLATWKTKVLDTLRADLFVIVDVDYDDAELRAVDFTVKIYGEKSQLIDFYDEFAPRWRESAPGNYLSGLPGRLNKKGAGAFLFRDRFRCEQAIAEYENERNKTYRFVGLGRKDLIWLLPHPNVSPKGCWIPCRENDWGGLCDHWTWCDRESARLYARAPLESIPTNVSMNAERHLASALAARNVNIYRGEAAFVRSCSQKNPRCSALTADGSDIFAKPSGRQIEVAKNLLMREALTEHHATSRSDTHFGASTDYETQVDASPSAGDDSMTDILQKPVKEFAYLIQGKVPRPNYPGLQPSTVRDVLYLSWASDAVEVPVGVKSPFIYYHPNTTWTQGRNILLSHAIANAAQLYRNESYLYYIFMDDDILDMFEFGDQDWSEFEDWLRTDQPAIGYILESRSFHRKNLSFNVDANFNAYHRATLGTLLPYDDSLDAQGIYFSQYIQNMMVSALFATQRRYWPKQTKVRWINRAKNEHTYSKNYNRSHNWVIPKSYMKDLWRVSNEYSRSFDFVNCGSTNTTKYCEYDGSHHANTKTKCGPATEDWIVNIMNISHPFAQKKLKFIRQHDSFLKNVRAQAPLSCLDDALMFDAVASLNEKTNQHLVYQDDPDRITQT